MSPPRIRGWLIAASAVTAGILTGLAAASGSGPFDGLRPHIASHLVGSEVARTPLNAGTLFPPVQPQVIQRVVTVMGNPPLAARTQSQSHGTESDHHGVHSPTPPRSTPRPSPTSNPGGGGGDN